MAQQQPSTESVPTKPHDPDEILHTPTRHRARWIMGILLLVMILTTFTVGDEIVKLMTGQARSSAYANWNRPGKGVQSISLEEWQGKNRSLRKMYGALGRQIDENQMKEEVAQVFVVGALASDAGVTVTDTEIGNFVVARFGSAANYRLTLPQHRLTPTEFEDSLREVLISERYTRLMTGAWNTPDVAEIEKTWKKQHQEYAFDYVSLPIESMIEQAKKQPLTDEELHSYLDGMPQPKKDTYKTKEKLAAELAGFPYEGSSPDALFAKFPKPTDEAEIEKAAQAYFDANGRKRWAGKTFEEVKDAARNEALIYGSLLAWLTEMRAREERGLAVNLGADGGVLGLQHQHMPAPVEQSEWLANKPAPWMGTQAALALFANPNEAQAGKLYSKVIVDEGGFTIVQVYDKREPVMPPFEELADKLREEMWQKRGKDFAIARLEVLRNQFGTRPETEPGKPAPVWLPEVEEAQFYEVLKNAGFPAQLRDFKERMPPMTAGEPPAAVDLFARTQAALYTSKPGTVLPAVSDFEGKNAYLMRTRGARDPDLARMKANEFSSASSSLQQAGMNEAHQRLFSLNALQTRFGLAFNEKQNGGE
jgi:hypothetical protein